MGATAEIFTHGFDVSPVRKKLTLGWRGKTAPVPDIVFEDVTPVSAPAVMRVPIAALAERVGPWIKPSPLAQCLGYWRDWMRKDDRDLGAKSQGVIRGGDDDTYDMSAVSEAAVARIACEVAEATDAMIESLDRHHKAAIYRSCGVASVWRFPNMDFAVVLPEAESELVVKLKKNLATRTFF